MSCPGNPCGTRLAIVSARSRALVRQIQRALAVLAGKRFTMRRPKGLPSLTNLIILDDEVADVDPTTSAVDNSHGVPFRQNTRKEVTQSSGPDRAVGPGLLDSLDQPGHTIDAEVQETDPDAVAASGDHRVADRTQMHFCEAEPTGVGSIAQDTVGLGRAGERAVDRQRDAVARVFSQRLDDGALQPDVSA